MQKEQKQHKHNMTKPQTNTFSKYCQDKYNTKKSDIKYSHIIQSPFNKTGGENFCTYYESFLNTTNSITE
jgi:hypothetical protein